MFILLFQIFIVYYIINYSYKKFLCFQEKRDIDKLLSQKADIKFVMNQLLEKADKNSITDFNELNEFYIGKNSNNINIGNDSHFTNQNINLGYITINKKGIHLDKIPIIKFNNNTILYSKDDKIFIKEGNNIIQLSSLLYQIKNNEDFIKKNKINITDLKKNIIDNYYTKNIINEHYYNKYQLDQNFISKNEVDNILVNNQGYTKQETDLIFMSRKDIIENFVDKNLFNLTNNEIFSIKNQIFNENIIENCYILSLNDNNVIQLSNIYKNKNIIGISYIKENKKTCIRPKFSYIWVDNFYGNVNKGDLIVSYLNGYGCKQEDDIVRNYTFAKCIENVNWLQDETIKKVYCLIY